MHGPTASRARVRRWGKDAECDHLPPGADQADAADAQCWTLRELLENPVELPPAVVPRLAWPGRSTLLAAREKEGKSTLMTAAAAAVSRGSSFLGSTDDARRRSVGNRGARR